MLKEKPIYMETVPTYIHKWNRTWYHIYVKKTQEKLTWEISINKEDQVIHEFTIVKSKNELPTVREVMKTFVQDMIDMSFDFIHNAKYGSERYPY